MSISIQVFSDLHLEYEEDIQTILTYIEPKCKYIFLVGDIGHIHTSTYEPFFEYISKNWIHCFVILGNNEFYSQRETDTYSSLLQEYKDFFAKYLNISLLDKQSIVFDFEDDTTPDLHHRIEIFGATLWSKIEPYNQDYTRSHRKIKEYNPETNEIENIGIERLNILNEIEREWIVKNVTMNANKNIYTKILMTHYPITKKHTRQEKYNHEPDTILDVFVSPIEKDEFYLSKNTNFICMSGHTHNSHNFVETIEYQDKSNKKCKKIHNFWYISNQKGKFQETMEENGFSKEGLYKISM